MIIAKKEAVLSEKSELEFKKMRSSQTLEKVRDFPLAQPANRSTCFRDLRVIVSLLLQDVFFYLGDFPDPTTRKPPKTSTSGLLHSKAIVIKFYLAHLLSSYDD